MPFIEPIIPIPASWRQRYRLLRVLLYIVIALTVVMFALRVLFPTLVFSFNFKTPGSSKNNILDPRSPDDIARTNGKVEAGGTLVADAGIVGTFSQARARMTFENKSAIPDTLGFSLRRAYRSFFLPTGEDVTGFPEESLYRIDGAYYALRDSTLYPFASDNAYLSRYPDTFAEPVSGDFLSRYPVSENWIGFRVGSVVSFADGVFLIVSDTEMRPVGSADIFLALGYHFEDVRPASAEEIGIYERGRIFLLGAEHPDGTLLLDQDTETYYLVDQDMKRPITDTKYRDFLSEQQTPILVSSESSEMRAHCTLVPSLFGQSFSCTTPIDALRPASGSDFEIRIEGANADIDINMLQVSFATDKNTQNMLTILSAIKQRLFSRFGLGNE